MHWVGVHCQIGEPDIVGLGHGATWAVLVDIADFKPLVVAAQGFAKALWADFLLAVHQVSPFRLFAAGSRRRSNVLNTADAVSRDRGPAINVVSAKTKLRVVRVTFGRATTQSPDLAGAR